MTPGIVPPGPMTVRAAVRSTQDLYHTSKVYTGLFALQERGALRVRRDGLHVPPTEPWLVFLEVTRERTTRRCAIDLHDRSDLFSPAGLAHGDRYFKRSYHAPDVARLPAGQRKKVLPFGLNYGCRGRAATRWLLWWLGPGVASRMLRSAVSARAGLREDWQQVKTFLTLPRASEFEQEPHAEVEPVVFFQTRVWEPEEVYPDDPTAINEERSALVRALRRAFGERFWGGLVPTAYALEHYADLLTREAYRRRAYVARAKRAMVAVYTRGLHHSLAFKLPEYLASAKAIVADELRNTLPTPLRAGVHYLPFRDPEECVQMCARLLNNRDHAAAMRRANHRYYQAEVEPAAHLLNCLARLFA